MTTTTTSRLSSRRRAEREFRAMQVLACAIFLPITTVARLLPRATRAKLLGSALGGSVFHEAIALANTTLPFAFMG